MWLAGSLLAEGPVPRLAETAGGSTAVRTMTAILPPPTEIAVGLGGWLDDDGPARRLRRLRAAARAAGRSAGRSRGAGDRRASPRRARSRSRPRPAACRRSGPGSSSPTTTSSPTRTSSPGRARAACASTAPGGRVLDAVPVLFDPDLDVAVLHVARSRRSRRSPSPPTDPGAGRVGATLGYPGGGALTIVPAAVSGAYRGDRPRHLRRVEGAPPDPRAARRDRSRRQRRSVHPGRRHGRRASSSPRRGRAPDVGYALSRDGGRDAHRPGLGRTAAVDTGECVRR